MGGILRKEALHQLGLVGLQGASSLLEELEQSKVPGHQGLVANHKLKTWEQQVDS